MLSQAEAFGVLTDEQFDFVTDAWSYSFTFTDKSDGSMVHAGSGSSSDLLLYVPHPPLSDSQADFDSWLNAQSITQAYDENVTKCIAQMTTQAPFSDEKSSLTIAHDCEAKLQITLTFPSFSGKFLTDSGNHGEGCSLTEGSLVC